MQAAVRGALVLLLAVTIGKGFNDFYKGLWENARLVVHCALEKRGEDGGEDKVFVRNTKQVERQQTQGRGTDGRMMMAEDWKRRSRMDVHPERDFAKISMRSGITEADKHLHPVQMCCTCVC